MPYGLSARSVGAISSEDLRTLSVFDTLLRIDVAPTELAAIPVSGYKYLAPTEHVRASICHRHADTPTRRHANTPGSFVSPLTIAT
jgi:hypothetical protein